jgi:hypothetical protein
MFKASLRYFPLPHSTFVVVIVVYVFVVEVCVDVSDVSVTVEAETVVDVMVLTVVVQPPIYTAASPLQFKQSLSELDVPLTASYSPSTHADIGWHIRLNKPMTGARV